MTELDPSDLPRLPIGYLPPELPDFERRDQMQQDARKVVQLARMMLARAIADQIALATGMSPSQREDVRGALMYASGSMEVAEDHLDATKSNTLQLIGWKAETETRRALVMFHTAMDVETATALALFERQRQTYAAVIEQKRIEAAKELELVRVQLALDLAKSDSALIITAKDLIETDRAARATEVKALFAPLVASLVEEALAKRANL